MNIFNIYEFIFKIWRVKRFNAFKAIIHPNQNETLIDVGGYPENWISNLPLVRKIDCINLQEHSWDSSKYPNHKISTIIGDGCSLKYADKSYDILFSNSVIEHVGEWNKQKAFATEARRVGRKIWIQTPALECPIEPHYMAPFVHWLPISIRRRILRRFTIWGLLQKPNQSTIDETIKYTNLLSKKKFTELFLDCTIITERILLIFPKSYVAYRNNP